ncbi:MAG TPA: ATP-binding protein [Bacillota bacterium]
MRTIRGRLAVTYTILIAVSLAVVGAVLADFWARSYRAELEASLFRQSGLAQQVVTPAMGVPAARSPALDVETKRAGEALGVRITVMARDGAVLADNQNDPAVMENHADRPEFVQALSGGRGTAVRPSATMGTDMLYVATRLDGPGGSGTLGVMRLAVPLSAVAAGAGRFWWIIAFSALAVAALAAVAAFILAGNLTRPIAEMTETADRLASGDFSARPPMIDRWPARAGPKTDGARRHRDELARLASALENMRDQLRARVDELTAAKGRFEAVLLNMASPVMMTDRTGAIRIANPAAEQAFGGRASSSGSAGLIGRDFLEVVHSPELADRADEVLASGTPEVVPVGLINPERWYNVSLAPVRGEGGAVVGAVAVFSDVSAMRQVDRLRRDFVANVSHELMTPLTAVRGFAETLLEGAADDPKTSREFAKIIHDESGRTIALVQDLLELSRLESGRVEIHPNQINAGVLVDEVIRVLGPQVEAAGLTLTNAVPGDLGPVTADQELLRRVFSNLIGNAVKHTPAGGRIRVAGERRRGEVRFLVEDTGSGIPRDQLTRIFERFYRVGRDRSRATGGTGLGLAIVKHIVEAHGGRVWAESEPGKGSRFWFSLPT